MQQRIPMEFFWLFVRRDLSVRYAGSTLGAVWNLIHPLAMIAIYMLIFSSLMPGRPGQAVVVGIDYGTLTYGVHLCAGLIPWMLFADILTRSVGVLIENGNFLQKVSFPPVALFTALLFNGLAIYVAGWLGFLGILTLLGHTPPLSALAVPGLMALMGVAALGVGLVLAGLNVFVRDTAQMLTIGLQVAFWLNPIVYFKEFIPAFDPRTPLGELNGFEWGGRLLLMLNPVERFVSASQWLVGESPHAPGWVDWGVICGGPAICLVGGYLLFRRMLPQVRDCL